MYIYKERTRVSALREKYDVLVGWGTTGCFTWYYHDLDYTLDYLVDGMDQNVGKKICNMTVSPLSVLEKLQNQKVCIVVYPNFEQEIWKQIETLAQADVIFHSLLVFDSALPQFFAKNAEDVLMLNLVRKLRIGMDYVDIGVCHPLLRNNTYLFYAMGGKGLLVEPNPAMHTLIELYRPKDLLIKAGVAPEDGSLKYYSYREVPGLNGFFDENPYEGQYPVESIQELPVININKLFDENLTKCPNILDLDVEGMQFELLSALNLEKYPIDIICCECGGQGADIGSLMAEKHYVRYAATVENEIWVRDCYSIELC